MSSFSTPRNSAKYSKRSPPAKEVTLVSVSEGVNMLELLDDGSSSSDDFVSSTSSSDPDTWAAPSAKWTHRIKPGKSVISTSCSSGRVHFRLPSISRASSIPMRESIPILASSTPSLISFSSRPESSARIAFTLPVTSGCGDWRSAFCGLGLFTIFEACDRGTGKSALSDGLTFESVEGAIVFFEAIVSPTVRRASNLLMEALGIFT